MTDETTEIYPVLLQAARARVAGDTWEAIAKELDRSYHTVINWQRNRRALWLKALTEAVDEALPEGMQEAWLMWRKALRGKGREGLAAADSIMRHARELRAKSIEIGGLGGGLQIIITPAKEPDKPEGGET